MRPYLRSFRITMGAMIKMKWDSDGESLGGGEGVGLEGAVRAKAMGSILGEDTTAKAVPSKVQDSLTSWFPERKTWLVKTI